MTTNGTDKKVPTILERIYAQRREDVELAKSTPGTRPEELNTYLGMQLAPPLIPLVPALSVFQELEVQVHHQSYHPHVHSQCHYMIE